MIECSRQGGHDIPLAVQSPANRRAHGLPVGLEGPGQRVLSRRPLLAKACQTTGPADLIRGKADTDSILDAIEVCVRRLLLVNPSSPGLHIVAGEGDEWTVGDGSYRIEGYYDELLPFLAREQVEEGLQYEGELPKLPAW